MLAKPDAVKLEAFKRSEYDRGSKKIIVDGVQWGWIEMQSHGSNGPTYHAHDMHGPVMVTRGEGHGRRKGDLIEHSFGPKGRRAARYENIGRSDAEKVAPVSTDEQLTQCVRELIKQGDLRSPAVRDQEIAIAQKRAEEARDAIDRQEREKFEKRVQDIIDLLPRSYKITPQDYAAISAAILEAMKWAQTQ